MWEKIDADNLINNFFLSKLRKMAFEGVKQILRVYFLPFHFDYGTLNKMMCRHLIT